MKHKKDRVSFALSLLTHIAAAITILCLLFIIAYILIRGVPNLKPSLFEWEYNTYYQYNYCCIDDIGHCCSHWHLLGNLPC